MRSSWVFGLLLLLLPLGASATTFHGNFTGATQSFIDVKETTQTSGDPEPLFGAPTVIGDQLLFFPSNFTAAAAGGSVDQTASLLETMIVANGNNTIDRIVIQEFGDFDLGGVGTSATSASVSLGGFVTILEILGQTVTPIVIPFTATYAPTSAFALPGDVGFGIWTATADIDLTAYSGEPVTKVQLSMNNILDATSEAGTTSIIQKKVVNGPAIVVSVPEPMLVTLLGFSLAGLAGRRSRA